MDRGGDRIRPFPSGSVRRCVRTQAARVRSLLFRTFRPSWTSVICLEKLRDLSLGHATRSPSDDAGKLLKRALGKLKSRIDKSD